MVAQLNGQSHTTTEYTGRVERVNATGILFAGRSTWANVSKFAGAVELPPPGATVTVQLDKAGYIRAIAPQEGGNISPCGEISRESSDFPHGGNTDRETRIVRMNCVTNAVNLLNNHGPASVADVLRVAAELEDWVLR